MPGWEGEERAFDSLLLRQSLGSGSHLSPAVRVPAGVGGARITHATRSRETSSDR